MLDTAKSKEELEESYKKINEINLTEEEKEMLRDYTYSITANLFTKEEIEKLVEKYEKRGGENMLVETLRREMRREKKEARRQGLERGRKEGRLIGVKTVAKEMVKARVDIEIIKEWTKLTEEEINKIEEEVK